MRDYGEFRIRIERGPEEGTYRVECSGLGGDGAGAFTVPFTDTELENFVLKVGRTRRGVRKIESPEMQLARKFGGQLFGAVMQGKTGELYRAASSEARATGQGLRITLSLTDVPELGGIPWEYLYDEPNFLSINAWTPVVRYLDLPKPRRALEMELPLRILGVISNPLDSEQLDVELERAKLDNALKPLSDANAVTIDWLEEPTLLALTKRLRPDTYHILHFIGHGGFDDANGEGALLFEDAAGRGRAVSGDQLAAVLYEKRSLRLVLLNSCEGARNSVKDPFSGVAASLVQREIPAVIGMQFEITDRAAVLFASEFYAMLAEGQPIDSAISEARLAIWADSNDVEWGTPVLFMRVADGRLFNVSHAVALPRPAPQDLPAKAPPVIDEPPPLVDEAPLVEVAPPIVEPPPIADEPASVVTRAPPVVEPRPITEEPPPLVIEQPLPAAVPPPPVVEPPPIVAWPPPLKEQLVEEQPVTGPTTGPRRRVPWRKVAIGAAAVLAVLAVIGLLLRPDPTGSIQVSTAGAQETGRIAVTGADFKAGETVDIYLDAASALTVNADANGSFRAEIPIGSGGSGTVSAVGRESQFRANRAYALPTAGASIGPTGSMPEESGEIASPAPVSPGILFYSDVDQDLGPTAGKELYLIDPVTRRIERLTNNDVDDSFPTWSPDYTQIAFSRGKPGSRDIFIRDLRGAEGSERPLVADTTDDWFPAWSKDGLVAFNRAGPGGAEKAGLWVIPIDGGEPAREVLPGSFGRAPAWSTDGTRLAFMSLQTGTGLDVAIVQKDGTGFDALLATNAAERNPTWSPNNETIVFVSDDGGDDQEIYQLNVATKATTPPLTVNEVLDGNPVWSPDGTQIAFHRASADGYHLWTMNADGTKQEDLMPTALGENMDPNWR
jgi:hypothetical protein